MAALPELEDKLGQWKRAAAAAAVALVEDGMVVGLGSGTTASLAVSLLGERVARGLQVTGIPTSEAVERLARSVGIPLLGLGESEPIDLTIDGADEVVPATLDLIKGRGGALLREKIVASASRELLIVVDERKLVDLLGSRGPVPVEVVPFGWRATARRLHELNTRPELRMAAAGVPFVTDGGHYILDCAVDPITAPKLLAQKLDTTVGVVEHGLFLGMVARVIVAGPEGVRTLQRAAA